jgi:cytochrome c oxidase subunit II
VRGRSLVAVLLVAGVVLLGASWFGISGREGLTPVEPASSSAEGIDDLYLFIGFFAVAIFLSVMIPLALILGRYRERGLPREAEGPQVRGHVRLELLWTAIPLAIVLVISGYTLYKSDGIQNPDAAEGAPAAIRIDVEGRQFYWRYVYPGGVVALDRLRLPVDRVVELEVTAPDSEVVHSFWVPALAGKVDAIPGTVNRLEFRPQQLGVFDGKCAELCGIQHSNMVFDVEVLPADEFERWLGEQRTDQQGEGADLGREQFENVCSKCHFAAPEYAPNISTSPVLGDAEQIRSIVTEGRGEMPAVGQGWSETELEALTRYLATIAPGDGNGG